MLIQDDRFDYSGYDEARGLWYTSLQLQGTGSDPEDGTLSGSSLQWSTNQTSLQPAALDGGNSRNVWLYSDQSCGGIVHTPSP